MRKKRRLLITLFKIKYFINQSDKKNVVGARASKQTDIKMNDPRLGKQSGCSRALAKTVTDIRGFWLAASLLNHASDCMRWEQMLTLRVKQNNLLTFVVTVNCSLQKTRTLQFRWVEYLTSYYARRHIKCSSRHRNMRARGLRTEVTGDDTVSVSVVCNVSSVYR